MNWIADVILISSLLAPTALAQSDPRPKTGQDRATKEWDEIQKKSEQYLRDLKEKDPVTWNKLRAQDLLDAQETLARFGYGTTFTATLDEKTSDALRKYQTRNGLPITGDADTATLQRLMQDKADLERHIPLGPRYMFDDANWDSFITVEGAWFEQGKEPDAKTSLLPARVECFKSLGLCAAASVGSEGSEYIRLGWYEIQRWDEYEVVSKPNDLPCGRETMHINRPGKTLLVINTAAYKNAESCTKLFGPAGGETISRLGDGTKIMNARLEAFRAASKRIKLISPEARSRVGP